MLKVRQTLAIGTATAVAATFMIAASPVFAEDQFADATPATETFDVPTVEDAATADVEMVPVVIDDHYGTGGPVDEATGNAQQLDVMQVPVPFSAVEEPVAADRIDTEEQTPAETDPPGANQGLKVEETENSGEATDIPAARGSSSDTPAENNVELQPEAFSDADADEGKADDGAAEPLTGRATPEAEPTAEVARVNFASDVVVLGVTWSSASEDPARVAIRNLTDDGWAEWQELEVEASSENHHDVMSTEPIFFTDSEAAEVVAFYGEDGAEEHAAGQFTLSIVESGTETVERNELDTSADVRTESFAAPKQTAASNRSIDTGISGLSIRPRSAWGPNESLRDDSDQHRYAHRTKYKGAVVHHTAGNNNYSSAAVPGIINGIYVFHARTNGWGDIGYHLIVDKYGGVWEGRNGSLYRTVTGAHAGGTNLETFGISVLGSYGSDAPPQVAQTATARAIAWMFDKYLIMNPKGTYYLQGKSRTVSTISGHRDVNATACPGDAFYARLPAMRDLVNDLLYPALSGNTIRYEGKDRYETAADAALDKFASGVSKVYIANGLNYPDALAGGPAAGLESAPLLLTRGTALPRETVTALNALRPSEIVILGGNGVVNSAVERQLKNHAKSVKRFGGSDRYETAAKLSLAKFPHPKTVYLASGEDFPDALAAVPAAGRIEAPLLLTRKGGLPRATEDALRKMKPEGVVLLGGTGAISRDVEQQVKSITKPKKFTRHSGNDRYDTSAKVTRAAFSGTSDVVYVAKGLDFPDALAGGPAALKDGAPLLLVREHVIPRETQQALEALKPKKIIILGGPGAVSRWNLHRIDQYID